MVDIDGSQASAFAKTAENARLVRFFGDFCTECGVIGRRAGANGR
jgi:hypothetical protein